jgi:hypothetical protein
MKKIFGSLLIVLLVAMMASGAWAASSTIDIADIAAVAVDADSTTGGSTGPYVVGSEWLAGQGTTAVEVDLGNAIPSPGVAAAPRSRILYVPGVDIGIDNTIYMVVTNGAIKSNTSYGLWDLTAAASCAQLVDFIADANGNYTSLTFKFTSAVAVGSTVVMTENGLLPAAGNAPVLVFTNAQLTVGNMTIGVPSAFDGTGQPLEAPKTTANETLARKIDQLSAKVQNLDTGAYADGAAGSVIDVEASPSRTKFIAEAGQDTPTTTTSTFAILAASAVVNQGVDLATAAYTITLNGDQTAIKATSGVKLEGTNFTRTTGTSWSISSTFAANDLRTPTANDVIIEVYGTTGYVIDVQTFTVTVAIDPSEVGVATKTVLDAATADVWTVNAMQARIPYMIIDTGNTMGYSSFLEITNRGSLAAQVSIDAVISNSDATANAVESRSNVLTVPANSVYIVRQTDLDTWFTGIDATKLYRVALTLTVVAPQNTVDVTAYHLNPGGDRTSTAVLYNTNNANDGRVWQ